MRIRHELLVLLLLRIRALAASLFTGTTFLLKVCLLGGRKIRRRSEQLSLDHELVRQFRVLLRVIRSDREEVRRRH